jgi:hypothetical protein
VQIGDNLTVHFVSLDFDVAADFGSRNIHRNDDKYFIAIELGSDRAGMKYDRLLWRFPFPWRISSPPEQAQRPIPQTWERV